MNAPTLRLRGIERPQLLGATRSDFNAPALADIVSRCADLVKKAPQAHTQMNPEKQSYITSHGNVHGFTSPVVLFEPREGEPWLMLKSHRLREALMRYLTTLDLPDDSEWWLKGDTRGDEVEFVSLELFQRFPEAFDDLVQISILSDKPIRECSLFPFVRTLVEVGIPPTPLMLKVLKLEEGVVEGKKYSYVNGSGVRIEGYLASHTASGVDRRTGEVLFHGGLVVVQPDLTGGLSVLQYRVYNTNELVEVKEFTVPKYSDCVLVHVGGAAQVYSRDIYNITEMGDVEAETNRENGAGPRRVKTTVSTNGAVDLEQLRGDSPHVSAVLLESVGMKHEDYLEPNTTLEDIEKLKYVNSYREVLARLITTPIEDLPRPSHLPVFDFIQKRWMVASVFDFKPQQFDPAVYDSLVMDETHKELIHDLVACGNLSLDSVNGKGHNTLMLFKGSPGSGKTLTVEAMAHRLKRGLFKTAASDLGTKPETIEFRLTTWTRLAQRWNAFLFIDESDVFVTRRDITDMNRNAVVNSFLKVLEYFEGTMFMTTNTTSGIDPAIVSRATLIREFRREDLNVEVLWTSMIKKAGCKRINQAVLKKLASHPLDGRQVKCVVENTLRLSKVRGTPLNTAAVYDTLKVMYPN